MKHDRHIFSEDHIIILAEYTIPCNGTVVAWEFCYRINSATSVTFYPGIWRNRTMETGGTINYELVQDSCQRVNLSVAEHFTAPAGSVVGLFSGVVSLLLRTGTNNSIAAYRMRSNQSTVNNAQSDVDYNIAIIVHLGKCNINIKI